DSFYLSNTPRVEEIPAAYCGWVGYFSYDTVRYLEKKKLPFSAAPKDDRNLSDVHLGFYDDVLVFDHVEKLCVLCFISVNICMSLFLLGFSLIQIVHVIHWVRVDRYSSVEEVYKDGMSRLESLAFKVHDIDPPRLAAGSINIQTPLFGSQIKTSCMLSEAYKKVVLEAKEYILAGGIFQIVLSQRFERRTFATPFEVYRDLRVVNPSPHMTYLHLARGCILVASSPEILTRVKKREIVIRPLAGTIKRGTTVMEDKMAEKQLMADEKQCVEHIMFVDLGRNDVRKVSKPGSVKVEKLMNIERYSHVMHISSTVRAHYANFHSKLLDNFTCWDALCASLPVGFGSVSLLCDMDIALSLRTILFPKEFYYDIIYSYKKVNRREWVAHMQTGVGIVADSNPDDELQECENKATTLVRAIDLAESIFVDSY
ncbi:hypothetical protein MKX01_038854, partial [Papaver californicum]